MKLGLSTYSLRKNFASKKMDFNQFSQFSKLFPEVEGIEALADHMEQFLPDTETDDIKKFQSHLKEYNLELFCFTLGSGEFGSNSVPHYHPDAEYLDGFKRIDEFRLGYISDWIDVAGDVGVKLMRVDCGKFFFNHKIPVHRAIEFNIKRNVDIYKQVVKMASEYDIRVCIENHGGFASDKRVLQAIFYAVPELQLCYDIGNVTDDERLNYIDIFGDRIGYVHFKTYEFDENGEEKYFPMGEIFKNLKKVNFDGWMSIEYEGKGPEIEGVRSTINLFEKYGR